MEAGCGTPNLALGDEIAAARQERQFKDPAVSNEVKQTLAKTICADEIMLVEQEETVNQAQIVDILAGDAGTRISALNSINESRAHTTVNYATEKVIVAAQDWHRFAVEMRH